MAAASLAGSGWPVPSNPAANSLCARSISATRLCSRTNSVCMANSPGWMFTRTSPARCSAFVRRARGLSFGSAFAFSGNDASFADVSSIPPTCLRRACNRAGSRPYTTEPSRNAVTVFTCSLGVDTPVAGSKMDRRKRRTEVPVALGSNTASPRGTMMGKNDSGAALGCGVVWSRSWDRNWPKWACMSFNPLGSGIRV